jgi:hypothetical protein
MGKVIWTSHLYDRVKQRGLDPRWVEEAVRFPDEVIPGNTPDSHRHIKTIKGYKIVVPVVRKRSDWVILTAWWNFADGHSETSKPQRSFIEKIIYKFVVALEKLITGRK